MENYSIEKLILIYNKHIYDRYKSLMRDKSETTSRAGNLVGLQEKAQKIVSRIPHMSNDSLKSLYVSSWS